MVQSAGYTRLLMGKEELSGLCKLQAWFFHKC